jgi:hypothetical protein
MSIRSVWAAAVATCALGSLSCTIQPLGTDAGANSTATQTVGDQCSAIALAFCTEAIDSCGIPDSISDCIDNETPLCCSGSACNAISRTSASALDACTAALRVEDCNSVVNAGPSIAACEGIPQAP